MPKKAMGQPVRFKDLAVGAFHGQDKRLNHVVYGLGEDGAIYVYKKPDRGAPRQWLILTDETADDDPF